MNILNLAPHAGGGVGSVLMGLVEKDIVNYHSIVLLDYANEKIKNWASHYNFCLQDNMSKYSSLWTHQIQYADIVLLHYWDHQMIYELLSDPIPECRLISWAHKNASYSQEELDFPDLWLDTSPIQKHGRYIWSTGNMSRFFEIKPKTHKGFNVGYVGTVDYKKLHRKFLLMCERIKGSIPEARFTIVGENNIGAKRDDYIHFTGKVDDVSKYLAEMDCFLYPLCPNHTGTAEQALGEALAAGVVPVTLDNAAEQLIISHNVNGMRAKSESEAVRFVKYLHDNPDEKFKMSVNARHMAKQNYNVDIMVKEWNEVFSEMVKMPKRERKPL